MCCLACHLDASAALTPYTDFPWASTSMADYNTEKEYILFVHFVGFPFNSYTITHCV